LSAEGRMKKTALWLIVLFWLLWCGGCAPMAGHDTVTQVSTIDALLAGAYDGRMTDRELLRYGDFGIGTFQGLDGEMIVLDGRILQVRADGKVLRPPLSATTPFAVVVPFAPDRHLKVPAGLDYREFTAFLERQVPEPNLFWAVRMHGHFSAMKTRSVPAQNRPYPPLVEAVKDQAVFDLGSVEGTLVGFRSPSFVKGINVPGFHLHFVTDDAKRGGHVLGFETLDGTVKIDFCNRFYMILPGGGTGFADLDLGRDRSSDLEKVEKGEAE
jgi:acetolactate decarboxylase